MKDHSTRKWNKEVWWETMQRQAERAEMLYLCSEEEQNRKICLAFHTLSELQTHQHAACQESAKIGTNLWHDVVSSAWSTNSIIKAQHKTCFHQYSMLSSKSPEQLIWKYLNEQGFHEITEFLEMLLILIYKFLTDTVLKHKYVLTRHYVQ